MSPIVPVTDQPSPLQNGTSHDVIVVGARAAGAATAMLLARGGLRVLLLERGVVGSDTLSTHALMRGGVLQLSRWGLLDDVVASGTPSIRRTTFRYAGERIVINIKPLYGVDALYAPRRTVLDPLLVRASVDAGAELHDRTAVTDLVMHHGRVLGIQATTADGRAVEIRAPLVIGADGIHSTVARLAGAPVTRVGRHATAVTYGYWADLDTDGYEWVFRAGACSGVIPTNDGKACVFAGAPPSRIGTGGVAVISDIVAEGAPDLAERLHKASPPRGTRTWPGHHGLLRRPYGPGWALVGDAGYYKDPLSAHGLTDALRDAELLAHAIVAGFGDDASMADGLAQYEATRDRLSIPLFDVVDRIAGHQWDDVEIGRLLLQLNSAMADEVELLGGLEADPLPSH
jgi:2-polyprenyl-6-methoxyphenol hydroxylase-like FAD-dependent oxidoreductase